MSFETYVDDRVRRYEEGANMASDPTAQQEVLENFKAAALAVWVIRKKSALSGRFTAANEDGMPVGLCMPIDGQTLIRDSLLFEPSRIQETRSQTLVRVDLGKTVCGNCPVKLPCLDQAIRKGEREGIAGGMAKSERQREIWRRQGLGRKSTL